METLFPNDILIVEDEWAARGGIKSLLQTVDATVRLHEADSFDSATAILASREIDFAFLDFDLHSAKNGFDILAFIREREYCVTSIVISGRSEPDFILECLNHGAAGFIPKAGADEFSRLSADEVLRHAIDTVLMGSVYLPASYLGRTGRLRQGLRHCEVASETAGLTKRQVEVLYYLVQGMSNKAIARMMNIAEGTVRKDYVSALLKHFAVSRRTELLRRISEQRIAIPKPSSQHPRSNLAQ